MIKQRLQNAQVAYEGRPVVSTLYVMQAILNSILD